VVKTLLATLFVLLIMVVPAMAQDEFPRIQVGFGYANLSLPAAPPPTGVSTSSSHNSGFASFMNFNFTKVIGLDYYMGYYSLGQGSQLFTNIFGGRLAYQTDKFSPYVVAGIGGGQGLLQQGGYYYSSGTALTTRLGGGVDYKMSDLFSLRFDVSKLQVHSGGTWIGNANIAAGIVFTVMQ